MNAGAVGRAYLLSASLFFFILATAGVYLRMDYLAPLPGFAFQNMVHAHSHLAYFGWASLAMMGGAYYVLPRFTGRPLACSRFAMIQLYSIILLTLGAFVSFATTGYSTWSIALSALNGMLWVTHVWVALRNYRMTAVPRPFSVRALALSAVYLLISYGGTWLVVFLKAAGVEAGMWKNAGVYLFLHNFVDGWMIIGLMGLISAAFPELEREFSGTKGDLSLFLLGFLTAPGFLLWLAPDGLPRALVMAGAAARLGVIIPYWLFLRVSWRAIRKARVRPAGRVGGEQFAGAPSGAMTAAMPFFAAAWGFFVARLVMQALTSLWPPLLELGRNRQIFIGYLHTELLGAISGALTGLVYLWVVRSPRHATLPKMHFTGYLVGTAGMLVSLFGAGFASLVPLPALIRDLLFAAFAFSALVLLSSLTLLLQLRPKTG